MVSSRSIDFENLKVFDGEEGCSDIKMHKITDVFFETIRSLILVTKTNDIQKIFLFNVETLTVARTKLTKEQAFLLPYQYQANLF